MVNYVKHGKVTIIQHAAVKKILVEGNTITGVKTAKQTFTAKSYVVATGGKSRPETGSTGEGFSWMASLGHTVEESDPQ